MGCPNRSSVTPGRTGLRSPAESFAAAPTKPAVVSSDEMRFAIETRWRRPHPRVRTPRSLPPVPARTSASPTRAAHSPETTSDVERTRVGKDFAAAYRAVFAELALPLGPADGIAEAELAAAERRAGVRLPAAL